MASWFDRRCSASSGDARRCRAPHHEGFRPYPEERRLRRVSKDEVPKPYDLPQSYFDEILTQSSRARVFNARQSLAATSQLTMVRLFCAPWPFASLDVCIES